MKQHHLLHSYQCQFPLKDHKQDIIMLTMEELSNTLQKYYQSMFDPRSAHAINQTLTQFEFLEQQIIQIVQMRTNMQSTLQIQAMQSTHFHHLSRLIEHNLFLQKSLDLDFLKIKFSQNNHLEQVLLFFSKQSMHPLNPSSKILTQSQILLQNFGRCLSNHYNKSYSETTLQLQDKLEKIQTESIQDHFTMINQEFNSNLLLSKNIYKLSFQELNLRDELLADRQQVFSDYQASNHELIQTLLSQKERDKNFHKIQKEKFEQLFSLKHAFDIQLETLNHHQCNLMTLYEYDYIDIKKKLQQSQIVIEDQTHKFTRFQDSLDLELLTTKSELEKTHLQAHNLNQALVQSHHQIESLRISCTSLESTVFSLISQNKFLENETASLKQSKSSLQKQISQLHETNNSLQSQLNQAVLRISQTNMLRQQMSKKIEEKNISMISLQKFVKKLENDLTTTELKMQTFKQTIQFLQRKSANLQERLSQRNIQYTLLLQQVKKLENQLTSSVVFQTKQKDNLFSLLQKQQITLGSLYEEKKNLLIQIENLETRFSNSKEDNISQQQYETLKSIILTQMERQLSHKSQIIDKIVESLTMII